MVPQAPQVLAYGPPSLVWDREYMAGHTYGRLGRIDYCQKASASTGRTAATLGPYVARFVRCRAASAAR